VRNQNAISASHTACPIDIVLQQASAGVEILVAWRRLYLLSTEAPYDFVFESFLLVVVTENSNHQQSLIGF
jgi:hypothetical protein